MILVFSAEGCIEPFPICTSARDQHHSRKGGCDHPCQHRRMQPSPDVEASDLCVEGGAPPMRPLLKHIEPDVAFVMASSDAARTQRRR